MLSVLVIIGLVGFESLLIYLIYKSYKKSDTIDEKVIFWLLIAMWSYPCFIYFFDIYNIPTKLGWISDGQGDKWFDFASNYGSAIIGATIGAVVLILVTFHQLVEQRKKDDEDRRIANLPLLRYNDRESVSKVDIVETTNLKLKDECHEERYHFNFSIAMTNIGLNAIRKNCCVIEGEELVNKCIFQFQEQECIVKGQTNVIYCNFNNFYNGTHKFRLCVYYQDLLKNWYIQTVDLKIVVEKEGKSFKLKEMYMFPEAEKLIDELPLELKKHEDSFR